MVTYQEEYNQANNAFLLLKAKRGLLSDSLKESEIDLVYLNKLLMNTEKARIIVQTVANEVQKQLEYRISNIVTMALAAVWDDPFTFKLVFETKRNQSEANLLFMKNGNEAEPMFSGAGGELDIASLALRIGLWSIKKTRATMILDEPLKFVSRDLQDKAAEMIKRLSVDLGLQIILISHQDAAMESADKVFLVTKSNDVSKITVIKDDK